MSSADLTRSPTWDRLGSAIGRQFRDGVPFADILEMNVAIKQRDLGPYAAHRRTLDRLLWFDDPTRKTIIEVGAGYGAMAGAWPERSKVYNVDLPEMLEVQAAYLRDMGFIERRPSGQPDSYFAQDASWAFMNRDDVLIELVPFTETDHLPFVGAYLFSTWALTETTRGTWDYWIERAPELAGAYVLGHSRWVDEPEPWPWEKLRDAFSTARVFDQSGEHWELAAVNR